MLQPSLLHNETVWRQFRERMAKPSASRALLLREADNWLATPPPTIVAKKHVAPSGDPHDYISIAPYVWPDPHEPDGLPWITHDGKVNPAFYDYDNPALEAFCLGSIRLLLATAATGSLPYAQGAGRFLRAWFLDAGTRMNPHLRYAQFIPGRNQGRPIGIIDTTSLLFVFDAATRLPFNDDWRPEHLAGVKAWVSAYLDWLLDSEFGRAEAAAHNNHGTWYDAQVTGFALFCDRPDVARRQIETTTLQRLRTQLAADGSQPHELVRTLSFTYCTYNLLAFACVARIAARFDIDLWTAPAGNGACLQNALQWMLPYYSGERPWTHQQIKPFDRTNAALLLNLAWQGTGDPALPPLIERVMEHPWQALTFSKASLSSRKPASPGHASANAPADRTDTEHDSPARS